MKNPKFLIFIILSSLNIGCTVNLSSPYMGAISFADSPTSPPVNTVPILWNMPVQAIATIQQQAIVKKKPIKLNLDSVMFETGKATLTLQGEHRINEFATVIQHYGTQNVLIEGHTDNTGSKSKNQKLSENRADIIRNTLINKGVNPKRLITKGLGEKQPIATNATLSGRQKNRRVELTVLPIEKLY
ncbi:MAG: OmpA family protein [Candidatus Marithrix sp.]